MLPRGARVSLATGLALVLSGPPVFEGEGAARDVLREALSAELVRSFEGLRQVPGPPLYFLGYEARDETSYALNAELGAISFEGLRRDRTLDVDVRVGTRALDSTHQLKGRTGRVELPQQNATDLTVDSDEPALRADIWRLTDDAFREAINRFTTIETNIAVTAEEEDTSADFSVEPPSVHADTVTFPKLDEAVWRERVKRISAATKEYPFIQDSRVNLSVDAENRYIVNSEGTRVTTGGVLVRLIFELNSQSADGAELERSRYYDGERLEDLPPVERVLADLATAAGELRALLEAPIVDPYTGPAIFRSRATGVFFHEILGHRLEGHRQKLEREGQTFTKMVGQKIVADFISVVDDPTRPRFGSQSLRGFYRFDDEGVPAQPTTLVENGVLKSFLMSRSPIAGFDRSNGHGRRSSGRFVVARMANTVVEAKRTVPYPRLREMLIEEIVRQGKPYGLIFDDISGGFTSTGRGTGQSFKVIPHFVYRVYPDGRPDEVVRGVDIVGTPLTSFSRILAAADDDAVFNGSCGAESGWVPVSAVAPSILVAQIEIEKRAKSSEKPPILPTPHHARPDPR